MRRRYLTISLSLSLFGGILLTASSKIKKKAMWHLLLKILMEKNVLIELITRYLF